MAEWNPPPLNAVSTLVACLAFFASTLWVLNRGPAAKPPTSSSAASAGRLKALIDRGRELPKAGRGFQEHTAWGDEASGVRWTRASLVAELTNSSQARLPLLVAWPANAPGAKNPPSTSGLSSKGSKPPPGGPPWPVVLVLHGTSRAKSDPSVKEAMARCARRGWAAVTFDSRYHGERSGLMSGDYEQLARWEQEMSKAEREAPYQQSLVDAYRAGGRGERPFIYDPCFDLLRVLDWIGERPDLFDAGRVGATGISLGGMIVWLAAAVDQRVKVAAPMIGVQGFQWAIDHASFQARVDSIRPVFEAAAHDLALEEERVKGGGGGKKAEIDARAVASVWDALVPGLRGEFDAPRSLALIAPRPLLLVQGGKDPRCPVQGVREAFEAAKQGYGSLGEGDKISLFVDEGAAHEATSAMWDAVFSWFERHL